ncbi:hypothetical protein Tco_0524723 [Tanacetum coccineum]
MPSFTRAAVFALDTFCFLVGWLLVIRFLTNNSLPFVFILPFALSAGALIHSRWAILDSKTSHTMPAVPLNVQGLAFHEAGVGTDRVVATGSFKSYTEFLLASS